jgi:hypothetical protein
MAPVVIAGCIGVGIAQHQKSYPPILDRIIGTVA